ncbi:MAG TPA: putative selenate reductase subunit YgfK, partial [Bacteroidetes bacterium]|nr:putative selenate reductase subunit YgfK [Bacteroidota bacterium]
MSDRLIPLSANRLLAWILREEQREGRIFGVSRELFFTPLRDDPFRMTRYGRTLETPVGVAAGPHTQLAQNILTAWLTGARTIELKTVQTLDELEISRPCIDMEDEGYNCEWSQELKLRQSYEEYLKAWVLVHLLRRRFGWENDGDGPGVLFNMSVGYDFEGIRKPNVQRFLDSMQQADEDIARVLSELRPLDPGAADLRVPGTISDSVTLSTMHGCPPGEIEKIGLYLIGERKLHTAIKLNPTLLGPDRLREILNGRLGYDVEVPDEAFEHDLKYPDALEVIRSLRAAAGRAGVEFGLKLTNTLETVNRRGVLPRREKTLYLSGRALHPVSVALARRLQEEFHGTLDLSFCAGADAFNTPDLVLADLAPVTVCTDLLKPGGYGRLSQYLEVLGERMRAEGAGSIEEYIVAGAKGAAGRAEAGLANLREYATRVVGDPRYHASHPAGGDLKTPRELAAFDCAGAPCIQACAVHQEIPDYLYRTASGEYRKAWEVIARTNPMPRTTGMICDHLCRHKCTRVHLDESVRIRAVKRFIAERFPEGSLPGAGAKNGVRVAILGAGPAGLSCAYFLALSGFSVELFESREAAGGMVTGAIPPFRLDDAGARADIAAIEAMVDGIH